MEAHHRACTCCDMALDIEWLTNQGVTVVLHISTGSTVVKLTDKDKPSCHVVAATSPIAVARALKAYAKGKR